MDRKYVQDPMSAIKPKGLWFSRDDDWINFAEGEGIKHSRYCSWRYSLAISKWDTILVLEDVDDILSFQELYGDSDNFGIDWDHVALHYDGIYIDRYPDLKKAFDQSPYSNFVRFTWFCTWDVSSGCLWDLDGIVYSWKLEEIPIAIQEGRISRYKSSPSK
jgi:hypothetical protein